MNITPLEIRQKVFEKNFRGYDKDEVTAFLTSLSVEWEKLQDQTKELKYKLEAAEKEVMKLREVENSLFRTLKTAEDTGANMVEQANKTAQLHMRETEMKADALMSEAKHRAKSIIEDAENRAGAIIEDMEDEIRQLEQVFRSLNANKDSIMSELKNLANDITDKLKRHNDFPADIKPILKEAKKLSREVNDSNIQDKAVGEMLEAGKEKVGKEVEEDAIQAEEPIAENLSNLDLNDVSEENEADENEDEITLTAEEEAEFLAAAEADEAEEESEEADEIKDEAETEGEKKGSFFDRFN
uniref:DivIVA domain-containing protein n=2 Tax=Roseivirga sp. TaxID=1964215 RepID=UPI004048C51F